MWKIFVNIILKEDSFFLFNCHNVHLVRELGMSLYFFSSLHLISETPSYDLEFESEKYTIQ